MAKHLRILLAISTLCLGWACGSSQSDDQETSLTASEGEPATTDNVATEEDTPAVDSSQCTITNETGGTLTLVDTAISEEIGTIAAGETGTAGGHFEARTEGGLTTTGFCSAGASVRITEDCGQLSALHPDGTAAEEGHSE